MIKFKHNQSWRCEQRSPRKTGSWEAQQEAPGFQREGLGTVMESRVWELL